MATGTPVLTGLTLSTYNIDLSQGPISLTFKGTATDNIGAVDDAIIEFSANGGFNFLGGTQSLAGFPGWVNGQDSVTVTVPANTHDGTYTISNVVVFDSTGAQVTYTTAQLQALGIKTSLTVTHADNTGPTLTALNLPSTVSPGQALTIGASATDPAGVQRVEIEFDKNLTPNGAVFDLFGLTDSWADGTSASTVTVPNGTQNGVYTIKDVILVDNLNNTTTLTNAQLAAAGFATQITVTNADTTPPNLTSLTFPTTIDLSTGAKTFTIKASATDNATGIQDVIVHFDRNFLIGSNSAGAIDINGGNGDSWADGKSAVTDTISQQTPSSGVYNITSVDVKDGAGNVHSYTAAQLNGMGIATSLTVIPGAGSSLAVNVHDISLPVNTSTPGSSLITSISTPSGHSITGYAFWDAGGGTGYFTLDGVVQADGQWIVVAANNLSSLHYTSGSGASAETLYIEIFDATDNIWSNASSLTATTTASLAGPIVNVHDISISINQSVAVSSFINSISNQGSDIISQYAFWDAGGGTGQLSLNGVTLADGQWVVVGANNLSSLRYIGGTVAGADTLYIEIFDATTNTWSNASSLTATTTVISVGPTVNVLDISIAIDQSIAVSGFISSIVTHGDIITKYAFWDAGGGTGNFTLNGFAQADGQWIVVDANNLSSLQYTAGPIASADTLYIEVFDATTNSWSDAVSLTATTTASSVGPVVNVHDIAISAHQSVTVSSFITFISNLGSDSITEYAFWDVGDGTGYFTLNGSAQLDGEWIVVDASNLSSIQYSGGSTAGNETLFVEVFDSTTGIWSNAVSLTVTTSSTSTTIVQALDDYAADHSITGLLLADTFANMVSSISSLEAANSAITSISLTDASTPTFIMTGSQYLAYNQIVAKVISSLNIQVTLDSGSETIAAPANAPVNGSGGHDLILGDGHHDQVIFAVASTTFTLTKDLSGGVSLAGGSSHTSYQLDNIEFLTFSDKIIFVENSDNANIARLYSAALGRSPDVGGLAGWEDIYANNISSNAKVGGVYLSLAQTGDGFGTSIAGGFALSPEFLAKYGALSDAGFVNQLYFNVLDRSPAAAELNAWLGLMHDSGFTRDMVLVGFAESPENIAKTAGWLVQV